MKRKTAFLFSGQGSQYVGMGLELINNYPPGLQIMEQAEEYLALPLKKMCFEGPAEKLNITKNTQPAIFTISYIIYNFLMENALKPSAVAGHSLGEYSALASAKSFSFEDGLRLVRQRGILMDEAMPVGSGTMAAVIGLNSNLITEICTNIEGVCEVANYNSPQQTVISGEEKAINEAVESLKKLGAKKVVKLDVSGPFHSSLMKPARDEFAKIVNDIEFKEPVYPVIANVTADYIKDAKEIKGLLLEQITGSVYWVDSIKRLIDDGYNTFIEVGPGRVLKGLMRSIDRSVDAFNVESFKDYEKLIKKL
ncbi:ACP S-malonyltransferase [Iocasia frigidifontis]|uniref:Malonyl CoA-acyl carrier protein transacylase n=1 Tax=Iocasia fonsfrigidae TaxID=2682810 RepID=A0A8A7KH52_9FIRM|nr:ACP S-malonyltransferase [Iocasia fonsfrigidae]QTL98217.1 ACP S-malonyltransferase [Iocasia fonsfrigidae]